jgi:ABC-type nitrate/sulfonate/bicarbonate transport system permease component
MRRTLALLQSLALPVLLIALWWVATEHSKSTFFPPLHEIVDNFRQTWLFREVNTELAPTVYHFAAGLALAVFLGILGGIPLGLSARARRNLSPITEFSRGVPFAALVPIGLVLFGPGAEMEISLIAFASLWPVMLNTADGIRGVDPVLLDSARVYGASGRRIVFGVALPAAMPRTFAGIRIAVALAVAAAVIANMFASNAGLGFFVVQAQAQFNVLGTWSGVLVIGLLGLAANGVFLLVEHRALGWYRGWRRSGAAA